MKLSTPWNISRLKYIGDHNLKVLRYKSGSFSHTLIRQLCMFNNISYENVLQCRINDFSDHWALVVRNDKPIKPFTDTPLFN